MTGRDASAPHKHPDGVFAGIEAGQLGWSAQFFLNKEQPPQLRTFSGEGLIHWLESSDDWTTEHKPNDWQRKWINRKYYLWDRGWNNGVSSRWDIITNLNYLARNFLAIFIFIVVVGEIFDLNFNTLFGGFTGPWEGVLGATGSVLIELVNYESRNDKKNFLGWVRYENERLLKASLDNSDDSQVISEAKWKAYQFLHLHYSTQVHPGIAIGDHFEAGPVPPLGSVERYVLALLREEEVWIDESKTREYADWLGWDDETTKKEISADREVEGALRDHIRNEALGDLRAGLGRLMDVSEVDNYLPLLTEDTAFWLQRSVERRDKAHDIDGKTEAIEEPFLAWIDRLIGDKKNPHYLVAEAAKGKTTLLNLLTLHLLDSERAPIWPLRVKLREIFTNSDSVRLTRSRISDYYEEGAEMSYIKDRFEAVMGRDEGTGLTPLLILDGLDEIPLGKQHELIEQLNKVENNMDMPTLVLTRPFEPILELNHATLGNMGLAQRSQVIRNIDLEPDLLKEMEDRLPASLLDRPFALLTAANILKSEVQGGALLSEVDLSLSRIIETYDSNYFEREKGKRGRLDILHETQARKRLEDAIGVLTVNRILEFPAPVIVPETEKWVDLARELRLIDNDQNLIDSWLLGYYAARSRTFDRAVWDKILEDLEEASDDAELVIRHLVSSAPEQHTPKWNELAASAPVVMDIAAQEWEAMGNEQRVMMMTRLGIPSDGEGRLNLTDPSPLKGCEIPELLSLLHFHCTIADLEDWCSPSDNDDAQWEILFSEVARRYRSEAKQPDFGELVNAEKAKPDERWLEKTIESFNKFTGGVGLVRPKLSPSVQDIILRTLLEGEMGKHLSRVRSLIPPPNRPRWIVKEAGSSKMYAGESVPGPLLRFINRSLEGSIEELESAIYVISMMAIHRGRNPFWLSRDVLRDHIPNAFELDGVRWEMSRVVLHRLLGYGHKSTDRPLTRMEEFQPPSDLLGLPEISHPNGPTPERKIRVDTSFLPLIIGPGWSTMEWIKQSTGADVNLTKGSDGEFNGEISINAPSWDSLLHAEYSLKNLSKQNTVFQGKHKSGLSLVFATHSTSNFPWEDSQRIYNAESQTWQQKIEAALLFWRDEFKKPMLKATLPSEDERIPSTCEWHVRDVISPRDSLEVIKTEVGEGRRYLLSFTGLGSEENKKIRHPILVPYESETPPTFQMCIGDSVPPPNSAFSEAYKKFGELENIRFLPVSHFDNLREALVDIGWVTAYLKGSEIPMRGRRLYRTLFVPGTDWMDPEFSDITFPTDPEMQKGGIERSFLDTFSAISEAEEDSEGSTPHIHLNRWYRVKLRLDLDDFGYWVIRPIPGDVQLLCQWCASKTVEVEANTTVFRCDDCKE